jgi:dipeptidyl aminopeptidase/acylaminoacyl peptidase
MRFRLAALALCCAGTSLTAQTDGRRLITLDDLTRFREVGSPRISPDGQWVAFQVRTAHLQADRWIGDLWMTSWDGGTTLRLTQTPTESEHTPEWSPDGRWLSFLSGRQAEDEESGDQLWLLDRRGGEAERVTEVKAGIEDYAWSPDARRLVLVISDGDSVETISALAHQPADSTWPEKTAKPIIVDRYFFKQDYTGYVRRIRKHLYLFELDSRALTQLTTGEYDDVLPSWSPDGREIAFVSKRVGADPDRGSNWDIFIVAAAPGAEPRQLTRFAGPDNDPDYESRPVWSPDGSHLAYYQGGHDSLIYYAGPRLAVIRADGRSPPRLLTEALDRHIYQPEWAPGGQALYFRLEDDREFQLARIPAAGGAVERLVTGRQVVEDYAIGSGGQVAALVASPVQPSELFAVEGSELRRLTRQNDSLVAVLRLAPYEEISARSRDGTVINGFLVKPLDYENGTRYPTILKLHGGPVSQYDYGFNAEWQLYAASGYAVVAMNPRGSSGRGEKFSLGIWADWGNRDVQDVLAGVDRAVAIGVADSARLGVGGWSYGGILTNYVIASDSRFKAAVSGASISNILAGYGTDMYVREYEAELGPPWKTTATWIRLSYPFLKANRIRTPTLFVAGQDDFNVPLLNSEQMYQALRSLGVETRLIIYPNQFHGIDKPSYQRHRYGQYLGWYDAHLK